MDVRSILRAHAPWLRAETLIEIQVGWDSVVYEVDGERIFRFPRRLEVVEWVRAESTLLPELAPRLSAPVPRFEVLVFDSVSFVGYRKLAGEPLPPDVDSERLGAALGAFLASLHGFPAVRAREIIRRDWRQQTHAVLAAFRQRVLPLLDEDDRTAGRSLLESAFGAEFEPALVHGDLGPEHILHRGDDLTGVIDWSVARVGDPALDFAWPLFGTGPRFADALGRAYGGLDDDVRARALVFHKLGPWHEALYGLEMNRLELIASGIAGIRERLAPTLSD